MIEMKKAWFFLPILFSTLIANGQIKKRVIFIGDAGTISSQQAAIINDAAHNVKSGKTQTFFLGNNIYPNGMPLKSGKRADEQINILESQFKPFQERGTPVTFIPGHRDWNSNRAKGFLRIKKQSQYLNNQTDSLVRMKPANGCPDPEVIPLDEDLILIALDTEWWLHDFKKTDENAKCSKSKTKVQNKLRKILYDNLDKTILLATHHPSKTNGKYAAKFSWKTHIFPFTAAEKHLYLPLPGIGSLYPLFKKIGAGREELHHPKYTEMNRLIGEIFRDFPNVIQVSGHEDGLQLIKNSGDYIPPQIVTGIGDRKNPYLKEGEHTKFQASHPGYVIADWLADKKIRFSFYAYKKGSVEKVHEYTKVHVPFKDWDSPIYNPVAKDSIKFAIQPKYDKKGELWRSLVVGNKYRKEWATEVKFPVFRVSEMKGGLRKRKIGGGEQTRNMRLRDTSDRKQYVLRGVEKVPDRVLPDQFKTPFTRKLVADFYSTQHPYAALAVPPIANALDVPHTDPVYGYTSPDPGLQDFYEQFAGRINLFEPWEPYEPTDNWEKGPRKLVHDNDNTFDADNFLKARMLDLIIGDWDRDEHQWRFHDMKRGNHKNYLIVPRDRDMAFNATEGLFVKLGKNNFLIPHASGFSDDLVNQVNWYMYDSSFLNAHPANQLNHDHYMDLARQVQEEVTDSVLEEGIAAMPEELSKSHKQEMLGYLKDRRDQIPEAMENYYKFSNNIVDLRGSNRKEFVNIEDLKDENGLQIMMRKIDKYGELQDTLMNKSYPHKMTKEIRLFLEKDFDSVRINAPQSKIKLRIVGGKPRHHSHKSYNVVNSRKNIRVYDYKHEQYYGKTDKLKLQISDDEENIAYKPTKRHDDFGIMPQIGDFNRDEGFIYGAEAEITLQRGFRKDPFRARHKFGFMRSAHTTSTEFFYQGEWTEAIGQANFMLDADIKAPNHTQNFFGIGNSTDYSKEGDHHTYYRTRFDLYQGQAALKWDFDEAGHFKFGPAFQYYHQPDNQNQNRFISEEPLNNAHDRKSIAKDKWHLGVRARYEIDKRKSHLMPTSAQREMDPNAQQLDLSESKLLPKSGYLFKADLTGYAGLNDASKGFGRLDIEFSFYKALDPKETLILANRTGGSIVGGKPAFYQYAYLGHDQNLLGFRQNRFAGEQMLYNNLELRWAFANFGNYVFKGQLGLTAFDDIGRVWVSEEHSDKWHNGIGGGVYFAPAYSFLIDFKMGHSDEGWLPYISMGFRF